MLRNSIINFTLKIGLAFPLFYTGLAAIIVPDHVISFWPDFISANLSESFLVFFSGLVSFGLIGWIFSKKLQFSSAVTMTSLIGLAGLCNITNVPFIVDLAPLFFISLALAFRYYPRVRVIAQTRVTSLATVTVHDDLDEVSPHTASDESNSTETVVESGIHEEHDQHIFVPKQ